LNKLWPKYVDGFFSRILSASDLPYPPVILMGSNRPDVSVIAKLGNFNFQTDPTLSDNPVWEEKWSDLLKQYLRV
jgi:hypothetical protein